MSSDKKVLSKDALSRINILVGSKKTKRLLLILQAEIVNDERI